MAQRVITTLVDDLDGETEGAETIRFGLDDSVYEMELAADNSAKLRKALAKYIEHARPAGKLAPAKRGRKPEPAHSGRAGSRHESPIIRAWAADAGISLNPRGRVPGEVIAKWRAAGSPGL